MSEAYENIDDWEIIKEFKQERLKEIHKLEDDYRKKHNKFKIDKKELQKIISQSKIENHKLSEKLKPLEGKKDSKYYIAYAELCESEGELIRYHSKAEDYQHDIDLSKDRQNEMSAEAVTLRKEINVIKEKIKELKAKQKPKKKLSGKKTGETTEECPKKCRIEKISLECSHNKDRGFTLKVPPHEPGAEIPYLHVLSSSKKEDYDIISVNFGGSCDHGKKASNKPVSTDHTKLVRNENYDSFCPRVQIKDEAYDTLVVQPSKVDFSAALNEKISAPFASGELRLLTDLIFKRDEVSKDYDLQFESCKGNLPYKARVIAHPKWEWNFDFSFGYKPAEMKSPQEYLEEKHIKSKGLWDTITSVFKKQPKTFNGIKNNGGWITKISGGYKYDTHSWPIEKEFTFDELLEQINWKFLSNLNNIFSSVTGFFELAEAKNKVAEQVMKDKGIVKFRKNDISKVTVHYPNIVISGKASKTEMNNSPEIGVQGDLSIAFKPLIGITGEIDVIQVLLTSMGPPFGHFLRMAASMSVGTYKEDGQLDTEQNFFETNLSLTIGATSSVQGALGFVAQGESLWQAAKADMKLSSGETGATGVSGIVGLALKGIALVRGMQWDVNYEFGGEFKTTGESGNGPAGFEINLKPIVVNNRYTAKGDFEFTGLAIVYALYKKFGAGGSEDKEKNKDAGKSSFGGPTPTEKSKTAAVTAKNERKAVIFKKHSFRDNKNDTIKLNAS